MKLISSTQVSTNIGDTNTRPANFRLSPSTLVFSIVCATFSPISNADTVGVVTSISQPAGEIGIDGRSYKLSTTTQVKIEGEKRLVDGRIENVLIGKSISYREDGAVIRQITVLKRPIDLPLVTPPRNTATIK